MMDYNKSETLQSYHIIAQTHFLSFTYFYRAVSSSVQLIFILICFERFLNNDDMYHADRSVVQVGIVRHKKKKHKQTDKKVLKV